MADNPFLAQLLGVNTSPYDTTYGQLSEAIGAATPRLVNPYASPGRNLASVAGAGLLAGLLGYQAKREAETENRAVLPQLTALLGAKSPEEMATLTQQEAFPSRMLPLAQSLMTRRALEQEDAQSKLEALQRQAEIDVAKSQAIGRPGALLSFDPQTGRPVIEGTMESEAIETPDADPLFLNPQTLLKKRQDIIRKELASGTATRTSAMAAADQAMAFEKSEQARLQGVLSQAQEKLASFDTLIPNLEVAMRDAGETGGVFPETRMAFAKGISAIEKQTGLGTDQTSKVAATEALESLGPMVVDAVRLPGPISEKEMAILTRSAPSAMNTPEGNKLILERMKAVRDRQREYVTFVTDALQRGYLPSQISQKWEEYRTANPLISDTGELVRTSRSWREYFGSEMGRSQMNVSPTGSSDLQSMSDEQLRALAAQLQQSGR